MVWKITYYNKKLRTELKNWPDGLRAKMVRTFEVIKERGANLGMPLTRSLGNGLFEIRIKAREGCGRVFFCYVMRQEIIILHGFIKKTQKMPRGEKDIALKRLYEVKRR